MLAWINFIDFSTRRYIADLGTKGALILIGGATAPSNRSFKEAPVEMVTCTFCVSFLF